MNINSVITLDNDIKCLLLYKVMYNNVNYFLALMLDEDDKPTDDNMILKEIVENGEIFVEREGNEEVINNLIPLFTKEINEELKNIAEAEGNE